MSYLSKASVAHTVDQHQMLYASERAVARPMLDYFLCESGTDRGKPLEFFDCRVIDIELIARVYDVDGSRFACRSIR